MREVSSFGVCPAVNTNEVTVVVNPGPPVVKPTVAGATDVCENDAGVVYTSTAVATASNYVWTIILKNAMVPAKD